jgi:hypothetical protein
MCFFVCFFKVRCNAAGIKLESLLSIQDTKTVDNKGNLLQYLTEVIERSAPDALSLSQDFHTIKTASSISLITVMVG